MRGPLAVEAYGLGFHRELLAAAGVRTVPLPLDEDGARVGLLDRERAVLLTPAHQFPTGGPLHSERRAAVIDWARARGGLILEDDYDGEFRYDRRPVGALQGLDPERVIHLGSVSKSLSPALRLGWMVLPERYVEPVLEAKGEREAWASSLEQLALADFLGSGSYDRHVRRMRQRYRRRRDRLVSALAAHAPHVEVTGVAAGLHAVLRLPPGTERSAVKAAAWRGIASPSTGSRSSGIRSSTPRRGTRKAATVRLPPTASSWGTRHRPSTRMRRRWRLSARHFPRYEGAPTARTAGARRGQQAALARLRETPERQSAGRFRRPGGADRTRIRLWVGAHGHRCTALRDRTRVVQGGASVAAKPAERRSGATWRSGLRRSSRSTTG
ncbi:hypothetical protein QFZ49_001662 [Streptomyces turgidiscabies]|uniref:Aminotransferase class I/classII large domain-containing protein n=1 Tax=Streptomyces turgidiscabies TaxID=85558 RepID=A0ABU0RLC4_9ACTN|nr:hypothetical protein [Streptomyces turgidiscabies]